MAREFRLRPSPNIGEAPSEANYSLDRRRFMRYSFNTAAGLITMASFGSIGFASLLMGTTDGEGGSNAISYWVPKGQENNVWYGSKHLEAMKKPAGDIVVQMNACWWGQAPELLFVLLCFTFKPFNRYCSMFSTICQVILQRIIFEFL